MNHAEELNKLIDKTSNRLANIGYRSFEQETDLQAKNNNPNVFFTSSVLGMQAVSHVIEDQALKTVGPARFYSAFQKFSRFRPQQERYQKILAVGNPVYLFGVADVELWQDPRLTPVALDPAPDMSAANLSNNWFVVLYNPQMVSMALVSRELPSRNPPVGAPDKLVYRSFQGFWTYDTEIISNVVNILDSFISQHITNKV